MSPSDLKISLVERQDVDPLLTLIQSAYRGESSRRGWTTEADILDGQRTDVENLLEILGDSTKALFQGRMNDELVACVLLEKKAQGAAYLGLLTVHPQKQNLGLGKCLLRHCESWAKEQWGVGLIEMTVFSVRKELLDWYERHGYRPTGEVRPFPMNDRRLGIPKVQFLEFFVLAKKIE